jgi:hypothetical protein
MKRVLIFIGLIFTMGIYLTSCYKDVILPETTLDPDGTPQAVSFTTDLAPLFNTSCAVAGCHVSGGHKPYLSTDESYQQLINGGFVNTTVPKASILYIQVNGDMKEHIPNAADRQKVYDWIRNGAPNN